MEMSDTALRAKHNMYCLPCSVPATLALFLSVCYVNYVYLSVSLILIL